MEKEHLYTLSVIWTGNKGEGTSSYKAYSRDHTLQAGTKAVIAGSSDPSFRGSPERYNPEETFVSSISACHMLWYLHLCSVNNIVVTDYRDEARGIMMEKADGSGYFKQVELNPTITLTHADMIPRAGELHHEASKFCFIANSCNFPITHQPVFKIQTA